ncbi:MAG TPA: hypothetical protein VHZ33_38395 [Trebonia sp.]|nr:hypothetical protein [Trebonia sp.]
MTGDHQADSVAVCADELKSALSDGDRALHADGDLNASRRHFERAYQLAVAAGDARAMALAALGLAGLWVGERRTVSGAAELEARLQHVLSLLAADTPLALRVRARLAAEADYHAGQHGAVLAVLAEIRARPDQDPVLMAEALSTAHHCLLGPDQVRLRRELAADLIKTSFRTERRGDLLMGLLWHTVDSLADGDPHAERLLGELRDHLDQRDHLAIGFVVSAIDVMLAIRAGRLDEAEALVAVCAKNGAAAGDIDNEWWPGAQLVTIRWYQGRLTELLAMLQERARSPVLSSVDDSSMAALAVAAALAGDRRTAASSLAALSGGGLASLARSSAWLVTMNGIVEAAFLLDDADVAARAYELLRPYAHRPMIGSLGITCFGSTQHALGVASLTCGRLDAAIDHLRAAVQHNLALAHWPAVLASRRRLAEAHARRNRPPDADAAARELATAGREAAELGLRDGPGSREPERPGAFAECSRVGRKWRLTLGNQSALADDSVGLVHLAVLIANPRQEILALDLVAGLAALSTAADDAGTAHPVLDRDAIGDYKNRLNRLDTEIDQLGLADSARAARARDERDWLTAQLASAAGIRGRTRSFPDQPERARVAVGKAIRRALAKITEANPVIGEHLGQAVRTGVRCSYWPG